jgi:hypothetical protein
MAQYAPGATLDKSNTIIPSNGGAICPPVFYSVDDRNIGIEPPPYRFTFKTGNLKVNCGVQVILWFWLVVYLIIFMVDCQG